MDLSTTNKVAYAGKQGSAAVPKTEIVSEAPKPMAPTVSEYMSPYGISAAEGQAN